MASFINEFKDTIRVFLFFFLIVKKRLLMSIWDPTQIYYNENLIFIDI
ncbi:hypothetical protein NC652_027695 [Populus alba x Populus x berolinensis]|nr:hypothetical protein NC652_027695 [Populus alba x Populus x berolinensis]